MAEARTIRAFLRRNGESTAVKIAGGTGLEKPVVNKHLYSLHESGQLLKTDATPPVWSLKELKNRDRDLDPDLPEMMEKLEVSSSSEEDQIRQQLRSGPVKAHQIASGTKKPKQSVNKALYEMMRKGEVEKCEESNAWTLRTHQPRRRRANDGDGSQSSHFGYKEHFEEIRELGEGAFGCVKLVRHKIDGTLYALKRVELTSKADSEVKALARLNHPNVVRYVTCWTSRVGDGESSQSDRTSSFSSEPWDESSGKDSGKSDAASSSSQESPDAVDGWHLFIQMEFCGGGTLSDWITERNDKKKPRIQSETLRIFSDIVGGMQFVHSQNFIHRDLKPDNVLFDDIRTVKIGDFGLVAPLCDNNGLPVHRSKRRGTPTYTSPEQANMRKYDEKTDVFPLGLIWFEMLWQISSRMERAKLWENLRKAEFPAGFEEEHAAEASLVKKMLSHNPEERPAAGEIRHTLQLFTARLDPLSSRTV